MGLASSATISSAERHTTRFTQERRSRWAPRSTRRPAATARSRCRRAGRPCRTWARSIEDNTIKDSLGGIIDRSSARSQLLGSLGRHRLRDRARFRDGVGDRQHVRVRPELSRVRGRPPTLRTGTTPPRIPRLRPSRSAADSARKRRGRTAAPRFPWTVGNALTVNGSDQPIFVDPTENVVTVQANSVETIAANGTVTTDSGLSGQVYAGIVNGVVDAPELTPETYNNRPTIRSISTTWTCWPRPSDPGDPGHHERPGR